MHHKNKLFLLYLTPHGYVKPPYSSWKEFPFSSLLHIYDYFFILLLLSVLVAGVLIFVGGVCLVYICASKFCGVQCPKRVRPVLVFTQSRRLKEDLESYARNYNPELRLGLRRKTTPTNQVKFYCLESDLFSLFISTPPNAITLQFFFA